MFAVLDSSDYWMIAFIVVVVTVGSAALFSFGATNMYSLFARVHRLEQKMDLILKHLGIEHSAQPLAGLSEEVRKLADDPSKKIKAIKLYREQTGVGLKEAKDAIEAYINERTGAL